MTYSLKPTVWFNSSQEAEHALTDNCETTLSLFIPLSTSSDVRHVDQTEPGWYLTKLASNGKQQGRELGKRPGFTRDATGQNKRNC